MTMNKMIGSLIARIAGRVRMSDITLSVLALLVVSGGFCRSEPPRRAASSVLHDSAATARPLAVIAYYPVWSVCDMPPQKLDWKAFSHLIFFWGEPTTAPPYFSLTAGSCDSTIFETGGLCNTQGWCLNPLDNGSNGVTHQKILRDSAEANGVALLLSIGGEVGRPAAAFAAMIEDTLRQDLFIAAAAGFARRHGYRGLDIDWEYPTRGAQGRANYSRFLTKLRSVLDTWSPRGLISMAVPTWFWWDRGEADPLIDVPVLNACVDFIDLMEYGMQTTTRISHYSPLFLNPALSQETWDFRGVREWKGAGVDSAKLVTLIPFEAVKMTDLSGNSPVAIGNAGGGSEWIGLRDVPPDVNEHWDELAKANWGEKGNLFYSYENEASIRAKVQYARDEHIRGVGVWELWRGWLPKAPPGRQDPLLQMLKTAVGSTR
jgi:chitinase